MLISSLRPISSSYSTENPTPVKASSSRHPRNFPSPGDPTLEELASSVLNSGPAQALTIQRRSTSRSLARRVYRKPNQTHPAVRAFLEAAPERNNNNPVLKVVILSVIVLASLSPLFLLKK